jgi:hypothetical protein
MYGETGLFAIEKGPVWIMMLNDKLVRIPELVIVPGAKWFSGFDKEISGYGNCIECSSKTNRKDPSGR